MQKKIGKSAWAGSMEFICCSNCLTIKSLQVLDRFESSNHGWTCFLCALVLFMVNSEFFRLTQTRPGGNRFFMITNKSWSQSSTPNESLALEPSVPSQLSDPPYTRTLSGIRGLDVN